MAVSNAEDTRSSDRLITLYDPGNVASEAYRTLRTSLLYSQIDDPPKVITMTSPGQKEGKSTTSSNLAVVLAQAEKNTILIDCDLRRPVIHNTFGLRNLAGLTEILAGDGGPEDFWFDTMDFLKVVTSGSIPPNPAELLGSGRFTDLLTSLRESFDYILLDAPPVQLVSDPAIIAAHSDGVLLVLDSQKTRKVAVRRSIAALDSVGARVLGTVMNKVKFEREAYYGYTYDQKSDDLKS